MMTSANICHHFEFFLMKQKIMLVIIHAKFEVNSCCGWDFRDWDIFTPSCTNLTIDTCTMGLKKCKLSKIILAQYAGISRGKIQD